MPRKASLATLLLLPQLITKISVGFLFFVLILIFNSLPQELTEEDSFAVVALFLFAYVFFVKRMRKVNVFLK